MTGGPSAHAGLAVDDRITARIDGAPVSSLSQEELVERLRGPVDTRVWLTILRQGRDRPFDATAWSPAASSSSRR